MPCIKVEHQPSKTSLLAFCPQAPYGKTLLICLIALWTTSD